MLSLRHFGLVLFIPWRVGAEESGAAKNGLRAQHLNNALTECLKWGGVNLCCHGYARELFLNSQCRRDADAARPDRPPGRCSGGWPHDRNSWLMPRVNPPRVNLFYHPYARARARQWSARCYGVARQRDGSRQKAAGVSGVLSLRHWVPKNLARRSKRKTRAIAYQSPLLKLSLQRVRFQRTSTRQQLDCAKTQ